MIDPNDEKALRLMVFGATLIAKATTGPILARAYCLGAEGLDPDAIESAHAIADAVVEEAKRLRAENEKSKREGE